MKFNISFKKQPKNTGLAGVAYPHINTDIKVNKKRVGLIAAPNWRTDNKWHIRLQVKKTEPDDNPNCDMGMFFKKYRFCSREDRRIFRKNWCSSC